MIVGNTLIQLHRRSCTWAQKRAAEKQRYELAEQKRQLAEAAIGRLSRIVCNAFNGS